MRSVPVERRWWRRRWTWGIGSMAVFVTAGAAWLLHHGVAAVRLSETAPLAALVLVIGFLVSIIVDLFAEYRRHSVAVVAAQTSLADKDRFLANVSHSLRTPLTAVLGFLEVLREDYPTGTEGRELLDLAATQAQALSLLTDDLILAGRLDSESIAIRTERVNLRTETERVISGYDPGNMTVTVTGTAAATTDSLHFRQIVRHLYVNALHRAGTSIRITLQQTDEYATLTISDNAPVSSVDSSVIFSRYSNTETPGHLAMGLSFAYRLAILIGGHLTYQYEPETTFTLQLRTA